LDKRVYPRASVDPIELVFEEIKQDNVSYERVSVCIEEVSYEGIRFVCAVEFKAGDFIFLRMPSLDLENIIEGRVVWKVCLEDGNFQYGLHLASS
jgi:hypothetical protein